MKKEPIVVIQKILNNDSNTTGFVLVKTLILNESVQLFKNFEVDILLSVPFKSRYYEFEHERSEMIIDVKGGVIEIDELIPGDEISIYTTFSIDNINGVLIKSFVKYSYMDNNNQIVITKTNEENLQYSSKLEDKISISLNVDNSILELNEVFKVSIEILNKGSDIVKNFELNQLIFKNCKYICDSLYINNNFINIGENLEKIKLGDITPFSKISIIYFLENNKLFNSKEEVIINGVSQGIEFKKFYSNKIWLKSKKIGVSNLKYLTDKQEYIIGEEIKFELEFVNFGNISLNNLKLMIGNNNAFIIKEESLIFNNKQLESSSKLFNDGIIIDEVLSEEKITINYICIAVNPFISITSYKSVLEYSYLDKNGLERREELIAIANPFSIINYDLSIIKTLSMTEIFIGEVMKFDIKIENIGNRLLENLVLNEWLMPELELLDNTIFMNGQKIEDINLNNIKIKNLDVGEVIYINYNAKAVMINKEERILDSDIQYTFLLNNKRHTNVKRLKNKFILIYGACINVHKNIDKSVLIVDDIVTINLNIENNGNCKAKSLYMMEICDNFIFVDESLYINNINKLYDVTSDVLLGDIGPNEELNITFKLKAINIPMNDTLKIYSNLEWFYNNKKTKLNVGSKDIMIKSPILDFNQGVFIKDSSESILKKNENVEFRVILKNTGNLRAYNIVIKENVNNFFSIDKVIILNDKEKIWNGEYIYIGTLDVNQQIEYSYIVRLNDISKEIINSKSIVDFEYYIDGNLLKKVGYSNDLNLDILKEDINISENLNIDTIYTNESFYYNLNITNFGDRIIENVDLSILSNENELIYLEYLINDEISKSFGETKNIYIKKILPREVITIRLKLMVKDVKYKKMKIYTNLVANEIITEFKNAEFKKTSEGIFLDIIFNNLVIKKETTKSIYLKDESVEYLVTIFNTGFNKLSDILVHDFSIDEFINKESIIINGRKIENLNNNNFYIESLNTNECIFIRYTGNYKEYDKLYKDGKIIITANFLENGNRYKQHTFSNNDFEIRFKNNDLEIIRNSSKKLLAYEDEVEIKNTIMNRSDLDLFDLQFTEVIDKNLFQIIKVCINGIEHCDYKNIVIKEFKSGSVSDITIHYKYKNYKTGCILNTNSIVKYSYLWDKRKYEKVKKSNILNFKNTSSLFKTIKINHKLENLTEINLSEITNCLAHVIIEDYYLIDSIISKNGNFEKIKKIIIQGYVQERIEYIDDTDDAIKIIDNKEFFSADINFISFFNIKNIKIISEIDDMFCKILSKDSLRVDILATIDIIF